MKKNRREYFIKYCEEHKDKLKEYNKKYRAKHREKYNESSRVWREENLNKVKEYNKEWAKENAEKIRERSRNRRKTNIQFKLSKNLRTRLCNALKRGYKSGSAVKDIGCSIEYLKKYIERDFKLGMNWNNWSPNGWHIDHQIPLSIVNLEDRDDFLHVCHYTNLQSQWAVDNFKKSNKISRTSII